MISRSTVQHVDQLECVSAASSQTRRCSGARVYLLVPWPCLIFLVPLGMAVGCATVSHNTVPKDLSTLREFYTTISTKDIYNERSYLSILFDPSSMVDTTPLQTILAKQVNERVLAEVAQGHQRGRRLFIGTTNMEAGKLVIWDMGAIATSDKPGALELFRKVMLASASIPVAFPAVYIPVVVVRPRHGPRQRADSIIQGRGARSASGAHCALPAFPAGPGPDGLDLSAGDRFRRALDQGEPETQGQGAR
jgi:hypothetical protein